MPPRLSLSARIIRIKFGPLRAAIWTAWFPFLAVDYLMHMGRHARLSTLEVMYLVGIDGINN